MKQYFKEICTNIIISILSILCIIIILSLIFYDDIAISRVIPETEEYLLSDEMKEEIESTNLSEAEEVIINYYIDKSDMRKFEDSGEYINKKSHTFAESGEYYGDYTEGDDLTEEGLFGDDGTK